MHEEKLLLDQHIPHTVNKCRRWREPKRDEVLMAPRLIHPGKPTHAQVELLPIHRDGLIERGEQHMPIPTKILKRKHHQPMVLARVAQRAGGTHIPPAMIRA